MTSWRSSASRQAQTDLDELLDSALVLADSEILDSGAVWPFGLAVDGEPELVIVTSKPEPGEFYDAQTAINELRAGIASRRGVFRAACIAYEVVLPSVSDTDCRDGIRVELQHVEGIAVTVVQPRSRDVDGRVEFGELRATGGADVGLTDRRETASQ